MQVDISTRTLPQTKKSIFLKTLRLTGNVTKAAEVAGYNRRYVYEYRDLDKEFASDWDNAKEEYLDHLEAVADERATREKKPSDLLLMFRLKGERPEKYRENYEHRLEIGGNLADVLKVIHQERDHKMLIQEAEVIDVTDGDKPLIEDKSRT